MVLLLGEPEHGLTGKIDVFQQICIFVCYCSKAGNFNFTPLLNDIDFNNLLLLRDETNYVDAKRQHS